MVFRKWVQILLLVVCVIGLTSGVFAASAEGTRSIVVDRGAHDPAVSPDGKEIAVGIFGKIWILPMLGGQGRQLTEGFGWDSHPAWSPDGRFISYAHALPSGTDLVEVNLATGGARVIYHTAAGIGQIKYHPKGGEIYFLLDRNQLDCHLWKISTSGGEAKQITFTEGWHEWSFGLSPDGQDVIMDSGRFGGSNLYRIHLSDLKSTRLTNTPLHQFSVSWSQDGKFWAFVESDNGVDSVMMQKVEGGEAQRVFSSMYDQKSLALAPDGHSAVLCAGRRLYRLDLGSGKALPIAFTASFTVPAQTSPDLVIINARLFDGVKNEIVPDASIEIKNGHITAIQTGANVEHPVGVPVIDAAGRFVMPSLMDNHYHYWSPFDGAELLSHGITSIRDLGTAISTVVNFKESIALGLLPGPDIYACGPLIDGRGGYHPLVDVELNNTNAAAPLVRSLKAQGADALKVYFLLEPPVLRAVIAEAKKEGLPVTGHIGVHTSWGQAIDAGISGLSHIRIWRDFLPLDRQPQGENESLDAGKNPIARMQADWSGIDPQGPEVGKLIQQMAEHRIGFDPTLSIQTLGDGARKWFSLEQFEVGEETFQKMGEFVARAQKMGVLLLAGTDNGSLFDELESYEKAGVPPYEILRSVTINGARWLGRESEFGTVEIGKRADLIIVDGDPLKDVKDLRNLQTVIKDGRIVFEK